MTYLATSINETPVIAEQAGVKIEDVRGRAVKFDENGNVILCAAGEMPLGIGIMTNDVNIEAGADVNVQIKDIGLVYAGAEIKKGAELAVGENGAVVPAESGFVCAIALQAAAVAGVYIQARLVSYKK